MSSMYFPPVSRTLASLALAALLGACQQDASNEAPAAQQAPAPAGDAGSAAAPAPAAPSGADLIDADGLLMHTRELASDEYGGRAPMSEGERLTVAYLERQFQDLGLEPLFGDSYRQPVQLVSIEADPATASMTIEQNGETFELQYAEDMVVGTMRMQPSIDVENSEMVFVGYGVVAPEYDWNDYEGLDVTGKTVVMLVNDPGYATGDAELFNGVAMTYYGRWTYKYEEAARQGAAAAIVIHDTAPASYGWDVVRNSWSGPQFHLAKENDNADRSAIESWITLGQARALFERAGMSLDTLSEQAKDRSFTAVPLDARMSAHVDNQLARAESYNVGAVRPGSQRPDELFIYTAHWDHLGTVASDDPEADVIYNGAVDNATGTAGILELAQAFASLPEAPARSVAFLAVTAEESGLLGSAWYAANPAFPMNQTVGGVNIDSMPVYGPTRDVEVVGWGASEMEDILREEANRQEREVVQEANPQAGYYYRSDHFNFAKRGVPMVYAEAGSQHREKSADYIPMKSREYRADYYHGVEDEVRDDWDLRGAVEDLKLYYAIGSNLANSEAWPNWYEGNEFRGIRDASRAETGE